MRYAIAALLAACAKLAMAQELSSVPAILVHDIEVEGNLIPHSVLDKLLPRYRNKLLTTDDLLDLAQQLTAYLIEQGYVNSGVILPDQKVENGVVHLQAIAGRVDKIVVNGNRHVTDSYITARIGATETPFNINTTVGKLQVLERDPRIKRLNAELKPSVERGSALLNIDVEESRVWGASAGIDNYVSPNVGGQQAFFDAYHLSVLGLGDSLSIGYRRAKGFTGGTAQYSVPVSAHDTLVTMLYDRNSSTIVTEPFAQLDIEGSTQRYGVALRQPFINTLHTEFALELGVRKERVESFLLGEPFSFSTSDSDGVSNVSLVQFTQEWVYRSTRRVVAFRSTFDIGVDALQASVGGDGDGRFVEWLAQTEWLQKLDWRRSTVGVKLQVHLSNDALPAYRKYSLGGANSVHGYRENLATRDNGILVSMQWTVPLAHLPLRWLSDDQAGQIAVIPFADYGYGWDYLKAQSEPMSLASVGVGIEWHIRRNSNLAVQYGKALIEHMPMNAKKVLQDDGVHFSIRLGF